MVSKGDTQKNQTVNSFSWLFQYWVICLKWLWCFQYPISYRDGCTAHASRKSCQKAVGSVNNLWNLHKIWVSFFDFFCFLFCFSESKKSGSAKRHFTFVPTSILLTALFFIIVHLNSMPSKSSWLLSQILRTNKFHHKIS